MSFNSPSSDFVLLATTTVSSSVTSVSLDGYFTSTYDTYVFQFYNFDFDSTTVFACRFRSSNAVLSASNYRHSRVNSPAGFNNSATDLNGFTGWGDSSIRLSTEDAGTGTGNAISQGELIIHKPLDASNYKMTTGYINYIRNDAISIQRVEFTAFYDGTANALSGITFLANTGNIIRGTVKLYGIK